MFVIVLKFYREVNMSDFLKNVKDLLIFNMVFNKV